MEAIYEDEEWWGNEDEENWFEIFMNKHRDVIDEFNALRQQKQDVIDEFNALIYNRMGMSMEDRYSAVMTMWV